ncbi:hypothetical protein QYF36_019640 [Acer negundo]|nr:hypothetical protein QYF36_019640 [Acer negundo]
MFMFREFPSHAILQALRDETMNDARDRASGYIASWLVKQLLQLGYTVKATVRDPNDPKKTEHLLALDGAKERLEIFKASLLEEGSFDSAIDACDGVFHTASPVPLFSNVSQADLVDPALKGTLNVLRSCAKVPSIRRVILTSSIGAVLFNGKPLTPDVTVDETWFSDPDFCEKSKLWYMLGKTLAEEAAWKFSEENRINMVAINPGMVIGPLLQPTLNASVKPVLNLVEGVMIPCWTYRWVDVRDVAKAHIQAFENPTACGRYCLVERLTNHFGIFKILRSLYPDLNPPEEYTEEKASEPTYRVSKERARSLGITYIPLEVSLKDTVESLKEKNLINA